MCPYPSRWRSGQHARPAPHREPLGTLVLLVLLAATLALLAWTIRTADQVSPAAQQPVSGDVTGAPRYPPGVEEYYYWNQGQPQPAPAE